MAANSSFTLNGALSGSLPINQYSTSNMATPGGNPVSRALNLAASPVISPSTPLKSTTINNADGSSTTHTFHAPVDFSNAGRIDFSKVGRIDSAGNFEVPSKIPGIGFAPASPTSSGALSSDQIAVLTGQAPASSLTSSTPTSQKTAQSQASTPTPSQTQTQTQTPVYTPPKTSTASPQNTYAGLLQQALEAQNRAANYRADLTRNVENTARQGAPVGDVARGLAGQESIQGTAEEQRLADLASNATALATAYAPTTQFGVLTNPVTGQPVSGGSAGSAAFQGGIVIGQQTAGQNYANMAVANNAAKGVKATLDDFISKNPTVNTSPLTLANAVSQWASGKQLGDPITQTFLNDVQEYVSTLAPILGIGGTPTDAKTYIANSFVNPLASGQSIQQVLQGIETLANNKLAYYATAGQGGAVNPAITSQSGTSGGLYDF